MRAALGARAGGALWLLDNPAVEAGRDEEREAGRDDDLIIY